MSTKTTINNTYTESEQGRLYGEAYDLQNGPKIWRQAAFAGQIEYVFSNCHFSLFHKMADRAGVELPFIESYLEHNDYFNKKIAAKAGITKGYAEMSLLGILYGFNQCLWPEADFLNDISEIKLYKHPMYKRIKHDIIQGRAAILNNWPTSGGRIVNEAGGAIICNGKTPDELLAHILQGAEVEMLKIAVELSEEKITMLIHDRFIVPRRINHKRIEDEILSRLDYRITLTKTVLQVPADLGLSL